MVMVWTCMQVVPGSGGYGHAGERMPRSYREPDFNK